MTMFIDTIPVIHNYSTELKRVKSITPENVYEEHEVNALYDSFKEKQPDNKKLVLSLLEEYHSKAYRVFIEKTGMTRAYFFKLKDSLKNEYIRYMEKNGYKIER